MRSAEEENDERARIDGVQISGFGCCLAGRVGQCLCVTCSLDMAHMDGEQNLCKEGPRTRSTIIPPKEWQRKITGLSETPSSCVTVSKVLHTLSSAPLLAHFVL